MLSLYSLLKSAEMIKVVIRKKLNKEIEWDKNMSNNTVKN